jgi:hypothetical protein
MAVKRRRYGKPCLLSHRSIRTRKESNSGTTQQVDRGNFGDAENCGSPELKYSNRASFSMNTPNS